MLKSIGFVVGPLKLVFLFHGNVTIGTMGS